MNSKIEAIQSLRYLYAVLIFLHHFNFNGTLFNGQELLIVPNIIFF